MVICLNSQLELFNIQIVNSSLISLKNLIDFRCVWAGKQTLPFHSSPASAELFQTIMLWLHTF